MLPIIQTVVFRFLLFIFVIFRCFRPAVHRAERDVAPKQPESESGEITVCAVLPEMIYHYCRSFKSTIVSRSCDKRFKLVTTVHYWQMVASP